MSLNDIRKKWYTNETFRAMENNQRIFSRSLEKYIKKIREEEHHYDKSNHKSVLFLLNKRNEKDLILLLFRENMIIKQLLH